MNTSKKKEFYSKEATREDLYDMIQEAIDQALKQQKQDLVREIEGMKSEVHHLIYMIFPTEPVASNKAQEIIDQIISHLKGEE